MPGLRAQADVSPTSPQAGTSVWCTAVHIGTNPASVTCGKEKIALYDRVKICHLNPHSRI